MAEAPQLMLVWIDAIGWTLLHFLWQGAALGLVYGIARPLCRSVEARYRLGMAALFAAALAPLATLAWVWPAASARAGAAIALPEQIVDGSLAAALSDGGFEAWLPYLVAAWFLGASIIGARAFAHWRRLAWLVRHAAIPLTDCRDVLDRLCRRFGITRRVRLLGSAGVDTPMLIGWLRPVILLPLSMLSGFSPQQIELIIAHELGHVRRWDYLANLMQVVIETVLFYHPVVHWISRDVRDARESCCDDLVLALAGGSPVVYANTLADLEQLRHDGGATAPALAASGGVLLERVRRIVGAQSVLYDPLPRSGGWPIVLLAAAGMLAALRLHAPAPASSPAFLSTVETRTTPAEPLAAAPFAVAPAPVAEAAPAAAPRVEALAPATPKAPATLPSSVTAVAPTTVAAASAPIAETPVARPQITLAALAPASLPRVADIRGRIAALPAPAAAAAPEQPLVTRRVQPEYPIREKLRGVTGSVELQFAIKADGSVGEVSVLRSSADHVFDRVAINALERWQFAGPGEPGRLYTQAFSFTLGVPVRAGDTCREVTGSHICRYVAAGEEEEPVAPGTLELGSHK